MGRGFKMLATEVLKKKVSRREFKAMKNKKGFSVLGIENGFR